jgi:hypothetical protein
MLCKSTFKNSYIPIKYKVVIYWVIDVGYLGVKAGRSGKVVRIFLRTKSVKILKVNYKNYILVHHSHKISIYMFMHRKYTGYFPEY